ncbi:MAG: ATP-dependent RNA helicase RhlE [Candidatus Saganbacteria bacterium]|uniref:ATP-dependent RNA helicase RhlE n=1 Tax=Candidatus Saganbacteria bacterium TaxID=2575572 RepID=A0A833L0J7_UNCSA|nr:MAG: ATP-dependent RNA helicase RhlE [Candidatus Saganbacteria bacterium]
MNKTNRDFYGLGIAPKILEYLTQKNFKTPTPIQYEAIPAGIEGKDIIGVAQTGTGKTLAFGIPMIQRLAQGSFNGLIVAPTRELALQIEEGLIKIALLFGMHTAVLIGGMSMYRQIQALRRRPRIIIATPGRLIDHLNQKNIRLDQSKILVLDEADRMLDMGFMPQIERILEYLPHDRQTMLFSATIPEKIVKIATAHMKLPISVEIAPSGTTADNIIQELFIVKKDEKIKLLNKLLELYRGTVLIFCRTKRGCSRLAHDLQIMGYSAAEIHSNRSLSQRQYALEGFKNGRYRILVATDIAARGIDVKEIELVINYDLPDDAECYVHRIGRTGRAGHEGRAIAFATPDQKRDVQAIERVIQGSLPIIKHPDFSSEFFKFTPVKRKSSPRRFYRSYGR